jgi:hypothetical protein
MLSPYKILGDTEGGSGLLTLNLAGKQATLDSLRIKHSFVDVSRSAWAVTRSRLLTLQWTQW